MSDRLGQGGALTADVMRATGNQVVEYSICQEACPWNSNRLREPLRTERGVKLQNKIRELQAAFKLDNLASLTPDQHASFMEPYRIPLQRTARRSQDQSDRVFGADMHAYAAAIACLGIVTVVRHRIAFRLRTRTPRCTTRTRCTAPAAGRPRSTHGHTAPSCVGLLRLCLTGGFE